MKKKLALFALSIFTLFAGSTILFSCGEKGNLTGLKSKNDNIEIVYGEKFNVNDFQVYATYENGSETRLKEKSVSQDGFTYVILKNNEYYYGNVNGIPDVGNYSFTINYQDQSCLARLVVTPATPDTTPSLVMSSTEFQYLAKYPSLSFSDSSVISPKAIIQYKYDKLDENGNIISEGNIWDFSYESKNTELVPGFYQLYAIVRGNENYTNFTTQPVRFTVTKASLSLQDYRLYKNSYNDITLEFNYDATKLTLKDYNDVLNEQITIMNAGSPVQFGTLEFVDGDTIVQAQSFSDGRKFSIVCKSASSKFEDLVYTDAIMLSITPISVEKPTGIAFSELDDEVTTVYNGEVHEITCFKLPQTRKTGTNIFVNDNDVEVFKITNDSSLSATNAGNYHVTFELLDKENFIWSDETIDDITFDWSITKQEVELVTNPETSLTYTGEEQSLALNLSEDILALVNILDSSATNAGSYTCTISLKDETNYIFSTNSTTEINWEIQKATLLKPTIAVGSENVQYGSLPTLTVDGAQNPSEYILAYFNVVYPENALVSVEPYEVTITIKDADNFKWTDEAESVTLEYYVQQALLILPSPAQIALEYSGEEQTLDLQLSEQALALFEVSGNTATNANSYTCTLSLKDKENYAWFDSSTEDKTISWSITQKEIEVIASPALTLVYNGESQTMEFDLSEEILTFVNLSGNSATNAGLHTCTISLKDSTNYKFSTNSTTEIEWEIEKQEVEIIVNPVTTIFTYDGEAKTLELGLSEEELAFVNITGASQTNAGSYTCTISLKDDTNYIFSTNSTTEIEWQINKAVFTTPEASSTRYARYEEEDITFTLDLNLTNAELEMVTIEDNSSKVFGNHTCIVTIKNDYYVNYEFENGTNVYTINWKIYEIVHPIQNGGTFVPTGNYDISDWVETTTFTYDGEQQELEFNIEQEVLDHMEIVGNSATNAGNYVCTLTSTNGYTFPNNSSTLSINWGIKAVVKFYNGSNLVQTHAVIYGQPAVYSGANPIKAQDSIYSYTFDKWVDINGNDVDLTSIEVNELNVYASYTSTLIDYTITFVDYDDSVISSETYHYGDTITIPENPTRNADAAYTYTFKDWGSTVATTVTSNRTYKATYTKTNVKYTVAFYNYDNSLIRSRQYNYNATFTAPSTPKKPADNTYTYTFAGWSPTVVTTVTASATYTATFTPVYIEYPVTIIGDVTVTKGGETLTSGDTAHYGDQLVVSYTGEGVLTYNGTAVNEGDTITISGDAIIVFETQNKVGIYNIAWSLSENPTYDGSTARTNSVSFNRTNPSALIGVTYTHYYKETEDGEYTEVTGNKINAGYYKTVATLYGDQYTIYNVNNPSVEVTTLEKEWKILKKNISLSNAGNKSYSYDGTQKSLTCTIPSQYTSLFTTSGVYSATEAGKYEYYITLNDTTNYTVNNKTSLTLILNILQITIKMPTATTLQFNGSSQSIFDLTSKLPVSCVTEQVDDEIFVKNQATNVAILKYSGTLSATEIGHYSLTLTLLDTNNYKFSSSDNEQTINWEIVKKVIDLPTQTLFDYDGNTKTFFDIAVYTNAITTTGDASASEIGDYTFSITLNDTDHYELSDGSTYAEYNWYIKHIIDLPLGTTFNYDGQQKTIFNLSGLNDHVTTSGTNSATEIGDYTFSITVTDTDYMLSNETMNAIINWSIDPGYRLKLVTINSNTALNWETWEEIDFDGIITYVENGGTTSTYYEETDYYALVVQKLNISTGEYEDTLIEVHVVGGNTNAATITSNVLHERGSNSGSKKFTINMFATYEKEDLSTRTLTFSYTLRVTWVGPY